MSCNGCRVLRKGCSEHCILRPCLEWIRSPQAQGNAVVFLSKFFGRSDLMAFIANVPDNKRSALFQSLLFEACGRTVNPVSGAVGLLATGNWSICQAAVETVLSGEAIQPMAGGVLVPPPVVVEPSMYNKAFMHGSNGAVVELGETSRNNTASYVSSSGVSEGEYGPGMMMVGSKEPKLLNLFA